MDLDKVVALLISGDSREIGAVWSAVKQMDETALPTLARALDRAETRESGSRLARAFNGIAVTNHSAYLPYLKAENAAVRRCAAGAFQGKAEVTVIHAEALLPLLRDIDEDVRTRIGWVLRSAGEAIVPALVRERHTPASPLRAPVLRVLADIAGFDGLDQADQEHVRRLIAIKSLGEVPEPMHLCGSWFAMPTADQAAALDAFELSDPVPVTMRLGASAWNFDHHNSISRDEHRRCRRMYVSPQLDGWTLVFGNTAQAAHLQSGGAAQTDAWTALVLTECRDLSRRFGEAHWYGMSCGDGWTAWCIARDGEIVRYYDAFEPDQAIGAPLPEESGYVLPHEDPFPADAFDGVDPNDTEAFTARWMHVKEELGIPDACNAALLAEELSVGPASLGPATVVRGRALLALTSCGREFGMPPGALRI